MTKKIARQIPHACPVCKGKGEITTELAQYEAQPKYAMTTGNIYGCHVCTGQGIIWEFVEQEVEEQNSVLNLPSIQIAPNQVAPNQIIGLPANNQGGSWTSYPDFYSDPNKQPGIDWEKLRNK